QLSKGDRTAGVTPRSTSFVPIAAWLASADAVLPARDGSPRAPSRRGDMPQRRATVAARLRSPRAPPDGSPACPRSFSIPWRRRHSRNVAAAEQALALVLLVSEARGQQQSQSRQFPRAGNRVDGGHAVVDPARLLGRHTRRRP